MLTSSSRIAGGHRNAPTLTVKKRAAWNPACPSRAPKVQCRFHQKLLATRDDEGGCRREQVVHAEHLDADGEDGEVDHVARAADGAELHQLDPVVLVAQAVAYARVCPRAGCPPLPTCVDSEMVEYERRHVLDRPPLPLAGLRRADPAHEQDAERIASVQGPVAAAAHVVLRRPSPRTRAPGSADTSRSPARGQLKRRPQPAERLRVVGASHLSILHGQIQRGVVALDRPPVAARVADRPARARSATRRDRWTTMPASPSRLITRSTASISASSAASSDASASRCRSSST